MLRRIRDGVAIVALGITGGASFVVAAYLTQQGVGIGLLGEMLVTLAIMLGSIITAAAVATRSQKSLAEESPQAGLRPDYGEVFRRYVFRFGAFVAPVAVSFGAVRAVERVLG